MALNPQEYYTQQTHTIPANSIKTIEVAFIPTTWYLVPKTSLPSAVYVSPTVDLDVRTVGIPIQGSSPSTFSGVRNSKSLYIYNSDEDNEVEFSITALRGMPAPVTSTPTTIQEAEVQTGVWQTLDFATTVSWDIRLGNADITLTDDMVMANPVGVSSGKEYFLLVKQDATGGRRITSWGTKFLFQGGAIPVLSYLPNQWDLLEFNADGNGNLIFTGMEKNVLNEFSPLNFGSCAGWYDASSIISLNDGDPVGVWEDLSGNDNNLIQPTASYKPLWRSVVKNGRPGLQLEYAQRIYAQVTLASVPFTVYSVTSMISYSSYDRIWDANAQAYHRGNNGNMEYNNGSGITGLPVDVGSWHLDTIIQTGSGGYFYTDGNLNGSNANAGYNLKNLVLGVKYGGGSEGNYYITEFIVYDVNHTDEQRKQVEEYLRGKYNLW